MIRCKLCHIISTVDDEDSNAIVNALKKKTITNTQLAEVLTKNKHPMTESSVRRHLKHKESK